MAVCTRAGLCGFAALLVSLPAAAQSGGVPPEWEERKDLATLVEHLQRIKPMLDQAKPQNWQGAPAGYVEQGKRVSAEVDYLIASAQVLAAQPQKLTAALAAYFRMQPLDEMLRSYADGIRKYQNPALAELLQGALAASAADREKLRQYILDLAAFKEEQFRVADQEAQECRAAPTRRPRSARKEERK